MPGDILMLGDIDAGPIILEGILNEIQLRSDEY